MNTREVWSEFSKKPEWQKKKAESGSEYLENNKLEIWKDWKAGRCEWKIEKLISEAEMIEELPFVKLERVSEWKNSNRREKDLGDLKIIKRFTC